MTISSHTSTQLYALIVTLKLPPSFFTQGSPSLYKTDFHVRIASVCYAQAEDRNTGLHETLST